MDQSSAAHGRRGTWQPGNKLTTQSNNKAGFEETSAIPSIFLVRC